ncbi:MAG: metallophosphoesterase family protein [Candidatus Thiodiazotropha endolucinida]|nr:metallophosphoesterase family protein [Candidatus Thiodiazotropha endolucinida]
MRILAFSDIHDNLACVRKLCAHIQVSDYDLVIVAGDIGDEIINEFFSLMSIFSCPIYYVYGNWDCGQAYDKVFSDRAVHLHHRVMDMDGYSFVGFSGCDANWGQNPIKQRIYHEVDVVYESILTQLAEIKADIEQKTSDIENIYADEIRIARRNARDRKSKSHRTKIARLKRKRDKKIEALQIKTSEITSTDEFREYENHKYLIYKDIFRQNKIELAKLVEDAGTDNKKLIIITHDRFYKLMDYFKTPPIMHLFGHRHGFKHTFHNQTHNVNVSVLDRTSLVVPHNYERDNCHHRDVHRAITGSYCVIDFRDNGSIGITEKRLNYDIRKWKPVIYEWFEYLDELDFNHLNNMCGYIPEDDQYL